MKTVMLKIHFKGWAPLREYLKNELPAHCQSDSVLRWSFTVFRSTAFHGQLWLNNV